MSIGRPFVLVSLISAASTQLFAAPILDQDYNPPYNLNAALGEGFAYTGQTVTPGITGLLTRADLYFGRSGYEGLWEVSVRTLNALGQPTGVILSLQTLTASDVPPASANFPAVVVNFSVPPSVTAGTPFALVVNPFPATHGAGQGKGGWVGTSNFGPFHYPGGASYTSNDGVAFTSPNLAEDLKFKTYVDPIPEPGAGCAMFVACAVHLSRRRRKDLAR